MYKKTLLISNDYQKDVKISWVIDNSWLIQKSPGWKLAYFVETSLLVEK